MTTAPGCGDIVVNSIHPGSHHSKITQEGEFSISPAEAAKSVTAAALLPHPCPSPRGQFIWHDGELVNWDQDTDVRGLHGLHREYCNVQRNSKYLL